MNDVSSLPVVSKYPAEASPKDMTRERTMSPGLRDGEELCKDSVRSSVAEPVGAEVF